MCKSFLTPRQGALKNKPLYHSLSSSFPFFSLPSLLPFFLLSPSSYRNTHPLTLLQTLYKPYPDFPFQSSSIFKSSLPYSGLPLTAYSLSLQSTFYSLQSTFYSLQSTIYILQALPGLPLPVIFHLQIFSALLRSSPYSLQPQSTVYNLHSTAYSQPGHYFYKLYSITTALLRTSPSSRLPSSNNNLLHPTH